MATAYRIEPASPMAVIGAGTMGAGIAQLAALSGHPVRLYDSQSGAAPGACARIARDLAKEVNRGRLSDAQRDQVLARLTAVEELEQLAGARVVIEAIVERLEPKQALMARLEQILPAESVLATNTSSISITAVAQGLKHRRRLLGWHFFNPATRMQLVEIIPGVDTDPALVDAIQELSVRWGKTAVQAPNTPGFLVNRVARPYYAEALRALAEGVASPVAIDRLLREAGGFAMGPFELMDLIGVDVNLSVTESVFASTAFDSRYAPHWIQQELVRAGRCGRKSGQGFYQYSNGAGATGAGATGILATSTGVEGMPAVAPGAAPQGLRCATRMGLLEPLLERLRAARVSLTDDASLPPECLDLNGTLVTLSDGRTANEQAAARGGAVLLLDLALDYARTRLLGVSASAGAEGQLAALAAVLRAAEITLLLLEDVAGLIVLRTVCCLANEAADLMGTAGLKPSAIDGAMRLGTAYPKGPLAWADSLGAARVARVLQNLQSHYGEARYRRAPLLSRLQFTHGAFHA